MITEISINNVATYQTLALLDDLKKINFIFGANGSGKTTISRVIDQVSNHPQCSLAWSGGLPVKVLVYNRDFIERNFNQENTVRGVFTLGDDQVEAERQIALLRPQVDSTNSDIQRLNIQLNGQNDQGGKVAERAALEPEIQTKCWQQKQLHDPYFQEAFTGFRNSAERFKEKILHEKQNNTSTLLSLEALKRKLKLYILRM